MEGSPPSCIIPPNCIASLLHWMIILMLLELLLPEQCQWLPRGRLPMNTISVHVYGCLSDAHFHLDLLANCLGSKGLEGIDEEENIATDLSQLHPTIASYVYPNSWDKSSKDSLKSTSFTLLVSIHKKSPSSCHHILNGILSVWE